MLKTWTILFFCALAFGLTFCMTADNDLGSLAGTLSDATENYPFMEANIFLTRDGSEIKTAQSDLNGKFFVDSLSPGIYSMTIRHVGYKEIIIKDLHIGPSENATVNLSFPSQTTDLVSPEIEWSGGHVTFIDKDGTFQCEKSAKK